MREKRVAKDTALLILMAAVIVSFTFVSCATKSGAREKAFEQTGNASWYGKKFHGRKTASGERFNMYAMTAAHKTLPFGTKVKVTNLDNKKSVVVKINDRGPFVKGRIIDLSYGASKRIGMVKTGVARVKIKVVKKAR